MTDQLPEPVHAFAVPVLIVRSLGIDVPKTTPRERMPVVSSGFEIIVDIFFFANEADRFESIEMVKRRALERGCELVQDICQIGTTAYTLLLTKEPTAELLDLDETPDPSRFRAEKSYVDSDLQQLKIFSRFTGLRISYCYSNKFDQPPFPEKPGAVYLFGNGRPPGFYNRNMLVRKLFGIEVWKDEATCYMNTPTRGRGRTIDEGGNSIFQVIGSNYYQLCLTRTEYHDPVQREALFRKLLGRLYCDLVEYGERKIEFVPQTTDSEFMSFGAECANKVLRELREKLERTDAEARQLEKELSEKLRERQKLIVGVKAMTESEFVSDLYKRLPGELFGIKVIEGVAAVHVVDEGVHITTDAIMLEYEGCKYDLGSFVIRLDPKYGKVEVWSDAPRHPKGHHHPHIDVKNKDFTVNGRLAQLDTHVSQSDVLEAKERGESTVAVSERPQGS